METGWRATQKWTLWQWTPTAFRKWKPEGLEFKVNLGYITRPRDLVTTPPKEEGGSERREQEREVGRETRKKWQGPSWVQNTLNCLHDYVLWGVIIIVLKDLFFKSYVYTSMNRNKKNKKNSIRLCQNYKWLCAAVWALGTRSRPLQEQPGLITSEPPLDNTISPS